MKLTRRNDRNKGFTLVELLVVIAIIALLLSVLMPALYRAREAAKRVVCGAQVKQMLLGVIAYSQDFRGCMPTWDIGPIGYGYTSYAMPQMSETDQFDRSVPNKKVYLGKLFPSYISSGHVFYCPSNTDIQYRGGRGGRSSGQFGDYYTCPAFAGMLTNPLGRAWSSYYLRGDLDPTYRNPADSRVYRYEKILTKHPQWIILTDQGGNKYTVDPRPTPDINHRNSRGYPAYFNNGWADGHVSGYTVKKPTRYPVMVNGANLADGMKLMEKGQW